MIGSASGLSLSVLTYNLHLFGSTALYSHRGALQETGFYYRDEERFPKIVESLRTSGADVIGVSELWDDDMRAEMQAELRGEYPHSISSPSGRGIGRAISDFQESWPRLAGLLFGSCGGVVNYFTKSHYTEGKPGLLSALGSFLSEDLIVRALAQWLRSGPVWGAGLLFLSRHPIDSGGFFPHETRADWEMLAGKGVIEATVDAGQGVPWTFSLGHYQEGVSPRAEQARDSQIRRARARTRSVSGPLTHMGDFNVEGGSREHEIMNGVLGLHDIEVGDTYVEPNPYQDKMQAPRAATKGQRIDYIYHSDDVGVDWAEVLPYWSPELGIQLSDHRALSARLVYHPRSATPARARTVKRPPLFSLLHAAAPL
jgi:endonuclease/exonuclease/phosphatase family protein